MVGDLRHLLDGAADPSPAFSGGPSTLPSSTGDPHDPAYSDDEYQEAEDSPDSRTYLARPCEGSLTVDDAENPLQLLARASNLQLSPAHSGATNSPVQSARRRDRRQKVGDDGSRSDIQSFFTGVRLNLDVGDDIDPIEMGLVTEAEAEELFD